MFMKLTVYEPLRVTTDRSSSEKGRRIFAFSGRAGKGIESKYTEPLAVNQNHSLTASTSGKSLWPKPV